MSSIFEKEIKLKKLSATYLIYGDKRVNLKEYAKEFASLVYSFNYNETYNDIFSLVDVFYMGDEVLKINEIRKVIKEASTSSYNGKKKIIIIDNVDKIDVKNSNLLLKTIEEPVNNLYFILLTHSLNILPTIKSRCIIFEVPYKDFGVDNKTYNFFDGNENRLKQYINLDEDVQKMLLDDNIEIENLEYSELDDLMKNVYINNVAKNIIIKKAIEKEFLFYIKKIYNILEKSPNLKEDIDILFSKILLFDKKMNIEKNKNLLDIKKSLQNNIVAYKVYMYFFITYLED